MWQRGGACTSEVSSISSSALTWVKKTVKYRPDFPTTVRRSGSFFSFEATEHTNKKYLPSKQPPLKSGFGQKCAQQMLYHLYVFNQQTEECGKKNRISTVHLNAPHHNFGNIVRLVHLFRTQNVEWYGFIGAIRSCLIRCIFSLSQSETRIDRWMASYVYRPSCCLIIPLMNWPWWHWRDPINGS